MTREVATHTPVPFCRLVPCTLHRQHASLRKEHIVLPYWVHRIARRTCGLFEMSSCDKMSDKRFVSYRAPFRSRKITETVKVPP